MGRAGSSRSMRVRAIRARWPARSRCSASRPPRATCWWTTSARGRRASSPRSRQRWKSCRPTPCWSSLPAVRAPKQLSKAVEKAGGEVREYAAPKPWELPKWCVGHARELGLQLDGEAAKELVARVGTSQQRLSRELEKIALALHPRTERDDGRRRAARRHRHRTGRLRPRRRARGRRPARHSRPGRAARRARRAAEQARLADRAQAARGAPGRVAAGSGHAGRAGGRGAEGAALGEQEGDRPGEEGRRGHARARALRVRRPRGGAARRQRPSARRGHRVLAGAGESHSAG